MLMNHQILSPISDTKPNGQLMKATATIVSVNVNSSLAEIAVISRYLVQKYQLT